MILIDDSQILHALARHFGTYRLASVKTYPQCDGVIPTPLYWDHTLRCVSGLKLYAPKGREKAGRPQLPPASVGREKRRTGSLWHNHTRTQCSSMGREKETQFTPLTGTASFPSVPLWVGKKALSFPRAFILTNQAQSLHRILGPD